LDDHRYGCDDHFGIAGALLHCVDGHAHFEQERDRSVAQIVEADEREASLADFHSMDGFQHMLKECGIMKTVGSRFFQALETRRTTTLVQSLFAIPNVKSGSQEETGAIDCVV